MTTVAGLALLLIGFYLVVRGGSGLAKSASYQDYGVSSEERLKIFCWIFVLAGCACIGLGLWIMV